MRPHRASKAPLLFTGILFIQSVTANLLPDFLQSFDILQNVEKRCSNPCGWNGQLCCADTEYCYTDANDQAQCGTSGSSNVQSGGAWQYYTTTYVQTDLKTVTTTFSSYVAATTVAQSTQTCAYAQGETPCGSVCCLSGQYCQKSGSCVAVPGGSSGYYSSLATVTTIITNTASAGIRPTTQTVLTLTSTRSATATTAYQTPVSSSGAVISGEMSTGGGLSGGAIAGIVIGVIAGLLILFLICACCCFKGLIDGLLAIFGLGPRRRRRTEEVIVEERHSHRSGAGRRWFGQPARRTEVIEEKKKTTSGFGRIAGVAGLLGGLALILGLKRKSDERDDDSVDYSSAYYSYYGSASSPSSVTRSRSRSRR